MDLTIKRVYDAAEPDDGFRVLVDRLWPRGVSRARAELGEWAKEAAPSDGLRRRWHADPQAHEPAHFAAFTADYRAELEESPAREALEQLVELAREHDRVTLLYGARNDTTNHAVVLRDVVRERIRA